MDFGSFLAYKVEELPFVFVVLLIGFTIHEFAHAFFANKFGDNTPRSMGRLTLNPRSHIDWLGMIFFLVIGIGWAKPVLVNRANFKSPRIMGIIVSFVGPLSNLILGFISLLVFYALLQYQVLDGMSFGVQSAVKLFFQLMITQNIFLFILNLIPFPPLDGYRILEDLLPRPWAEKLRSYQQWLFFAVLLMFFIPPIRAVTIDPIFSLQGPIFAFFNAIALQFFDSSIIRM
ncbi:site-2 protease family protein [Paenibacillus agricola]|uniref:Site-2 protease family protein n=1 Tax=Paenibacillus agricola TaxID=2716264 RepID=A0ABX0J3J7_9BACL|nr:site-2 protease family protein [Paenibacillus agricola]NHN30952.1 site-2 protease family protein [Paenibacillus agricola]